MNRRILISLIATFVFLTGLSAQETDSLNVESLLARPDHADMPWKVQYLEPILMYQQLYVLIIRTRMPSSIADELPASGAIHFAAKVADASGHWFPGVQYNRFEPAAKLGKTKDLECLLAIYLRPGEYTVAMMVAESATGKSNVIRQRILIPAIEHDPLPELNAHIPPVEFPSEFPTDETTRTDRSHGELFAISTRSTALPVDFSGPTRIDIVLNVSRQNDLPKPPDLTNRRPDRDILGFPDPARRYRQLPPVIPHDLALSRVLQTASLLSRLQPSAGCVYISAIDPLHARIVENSKPASAIDWNKFESSILKMDQVTIDARILKDHRAPGHSVHDFLEKLTADSSCGSTPAANHYVLVVSTALTLPEFSKDMRLSDAAAERAHLYLFQPFIPNPFSDDIGKIIKSGKARVFTFTTPEELRHKFAELLRDLRSAKN